MSWISLRGMTVKIAITQFPPRVSAKYMVLFRVPNRRNKKGGKKRVSEAENLLEQSERIGREEERKKNVYCTDRSFKPVKGFACLLALSAK